MAVSTSETSSRTVIRSRTFKTHEAIKDHSMSPDVLTKVYEWFNSNFHATVPVFLYLSSSALLHNRLSINRSLIHKNALHHRSPFSISKVPTASMTSATNIAGIQPCPGASLLEPDGMAVVLATLEVGAAPPNAPPVDVEVAAVVVVAAAVVAVALAVEVDVQ